MGEKGDPFETIHNEFRGVLGDREKKGKKGKKERKKEGVGLTAHSFVCSGLHPSPRLWPCSPLFTSARVLTVNWCLFLVSNGC